MAEGCQGSGFICEPQVAREAGPLMATTLPLSHPNDEKEGFFPRNHSSSSMNSIVGNHHHNHTTDTCVPLMGEERIEMADPKANETDCKEVRVTWRVTASFSTAWGQLLAGGSPCHQPLGPFMGGLGLATAELPWITWSTGNQVAAL